MPIWVITAAEWAISQLLAHLNGDIAKKALVTILNLIDSSVQDLDARVTGPYKGLADEAAAAFHSAVMAIEAALVKPVA